MKKCIDRWQKADIKLRAELIAQVLIFVLIAPRAFMFFFGTSADSMMSPRAILVGLLVVLAFAANYMAALSLRKKTNSLERWALFMLSVVLVPLPLAVAGHVSEKLKNPWASILGSGATYIALQAAMSIIFSLWLTGIAWIVF